jgi:hypothetical protein
VSVVKGIEERLRLSGSRIPLKVCSKRIILAQVAVTVGLRTEIVFDPVAAAASEALFLVRTWDLVCVLLRLSRWRAFSHEQDENHDEAHM